MSRLQALLDVASQHGVSIEDADRLLKAQEAVTGLLEAAATLKTAIAGASEAFERFSAAVSALELDEVKS